MWENGQLWELGIPKNAMSATAHSVNELGGAAGWAVFPLDRGGWRYSPMHWTRNVFSDIQLPVGFTSGSATALNDDDVIVGIAIKTVKVDGGVAYAETAWISHRGVTNDLNNLLAPSADVHVYYAVDIATDGQIIGLGTTSIGQAVTVLLTPVMIQGDLDSDCVVNATDLSILLMEWGTVSEGADGAADFNRDGMVDGLDLGFLLLNWTAG
jgi:hypothetical protein